MRSRIFWVSAWSAMGHAERCQCHKTEFGGSCALTRALFSRHGGKSLPRWRVMFVAWLPQRLSGSEKMVSKLVGELSSVWLAQRFTAVDRRGGRYVKKSLRNRAPEVGIQVRLQPLLACQDRRHDLTQRLQMEPETHSPPSVRLSHSRLCIC